jgi:tetratricopeptide (TPR) repeat protein
VLALLEALPEASPCLPRAPPQRRPHTLDALTRVLLRGRQGPPLLLGGEALHGIAPATPGRLDRRLERLPTARGLLRVNSRSEYQHGWGSTTSDPPRRRAPWPPLSADECLHALLGDDASLQPLTPLRLRRTQGHPVFLAEPGRTVVATQGLGGAPGAARRAQALPSLQGPATGLAVRAARIDRRPPAAHHLLQTAAVSGHAGPLVLLQAMADRTEDALHRSLAPLQGAACLYETRLFPAPESTVQHARTHAVAYGSRLQARRRGLPARRVEALEAFAPERVAALVAGRSPDQVDRLAPHALRGAVWGTAGAYGPPAGARASDRAACRGAVASVAQALQARAPRHDHGDPRALALELGLGVGGSLHALGAAGRHLALVAEAEARARALDERARLGRVLARLAPVRRSTGDADGAMAAGQQARERAAALGDSAVQMHACHTLGQAYQAISGFGRAAALLRRHGEAADRESGRPRTRGRSEARAWRARTWGALGAFAEGRRHGEAARRLATPEGRGATPLLAHGCLGRLSLAHGDLAPAIRGCDQGLPRGRTSGHQVWWRLLTAALGSASALPGRLAAGRARLEEAISAMGHPGGRPRYADQVAGRREGCRRAGRGEEAWPHAPQALDLARQDKARADAARALPQLGVVHASAAPPAVAPAAAHSQPALALAEALGLRPLQAQGHRGLGTL